MVTASLSLAAQTIPSDSSKVSKLEKTQELDEVVVKSSLPKIRNNANGMTCIIQGSELEKAGNSKDVLGRLPSIQKADDGVEVFGRGAAEVYVNNRKLYDLKELERIPSDQIMSVEIISNPGAHYAATTKAVVRIKTKRPQGEGWGFREEAKVNHFVDWGAREQLDVNYRRGGLDISASLTASTTNGGASAYECIESYSDGKLLGQVIDNMQNRYHERTLCPGLRINYAFNENQSVGAQYYYFRQPYAKTFTNLPSVFTYGGSFLESTMTRLRISSPAYSHQANAYYSGKVKQWQTDLNLDGFWNDTKGTTVTEDNHAFNHSANRLYTAKLTVEHPLFGGTISFGTEYNDTHRTEQNINPAVKNGDSKVKERIWSGFAEYRRILFGKLRLQGGLRYENVKSDFYEEGKHTMDRDYADWFPSLGLSIALGKVQLSGNYGVDITRPSFANLSDNIIYINRYSYQGGNSKLKPTYSRDLSLSASWKWLWAQAIYSRVTNDIAFENTGYSDNDKRVTLIHPNNMPTFHRYVVQAFAQPTLFKIWHPTWGFVYCQQDFEANTIDGGKQKLDRPLLNIICNNLFLLPHSWRIGVDFHCQTSGDYSTYRIHNALVQVSGLIQKSLLRDRLDLSLQAGNLLHSKHQAVSIFSSRTLYQENRYYTRLELTATYKFNLANSKYKGGNADGKQRKRME